jgi:23S rRNA (cytidine2498-2'-O)-methyltransferase
MSAKRTRGGAAESAHASRAEPGKAPNARTERRILRPLEANRAFTGYLAPEGFVGDLIEELGNAVCEVHGRLVVVEGPPQSAAWAANIWLEPQRLEITSIRDAVKSLRAIQRNWALYDLSHHRRAALIAGQLPKVSAKPIAFGVAAPTAPLGSWTLLDRDLLLASPRCSSPFPNGAIDFIEDRTGPPNRAYLKLWEAFTRLGKTPRKGDLCVDLGASPGGWTWVLQGLCARVIAVDKAPIDPAVARLQNVTQRLDSAFALAPEDIGPADWLFSDIICYPERLLRLIERWINSGLASNMVCTIKFQGPTDFSMQRAFAAIPGANLMHLHNNKHELTWTWLDKGRPS